MKTMQAVRMHTYGGPEVLFSQTGHTRGKIVLRVV